LIRLKGRSERRCRKWLKSWEFSSYFECQYITVVRISFESFWMLTAAFPSCATYLQLTTTPSTWSSSVCNLPLNSANPLTVGFWWPLNVLGAPDVLSLLEVTFLFAWTLSRFPYLELAGSGLAGKGLFALEEPDVTLGMGLGFELGLFSASFLAAEPIFA
jgi:hypothetical protein